MPESAASLIRDDPPSSRRKSGKSALKSLFGRETREDFPALTGLRAIAAYLVFWHHYTPSTAVIGTPLHRLLLEGHVGVTVFYVLSGFLISWNYMERTSQGTAGFWGPYILKRVARIQPVYLLLLLIWCLAPWLGFSSHAVASPEEIVLNATLLKGFFYVHAFSGITQAWSLTVEETFYLSAPLIFMLLRRWGLIATQALLWTVGLILMAIGFFSPGQFAVLYTFFGRSCEFIIGIACGVWLLNHREDIGTVRGVKCTAIGILGFGVILTWMALLQSGEVFGLFTPVGMALNNLFLPTFIGFTILGLVLESSIVSWLLSTPLFLILGRSSYAFYLLHMGVLAELIYPRLWGNNGAGRLLLFFVAMNVLSVLVYVLYEKPANRLVRAAGANWLGFRTEQPPISGPSRIRRQAIAAFSVLLLLMGFWSLGLLPAYKPRIRSSIYLPDSPALNAPARAVTDFGTITSRFQDVRGLTGTVAGKALNRYIFAHANSTIEYRLNGQWESFSFSMGLDDFGGMDPGSVTYIVKGDGKILFQSGVIKAMSLSDPVTVGISSVQTLQLIVAASGAGITSDEAYWIDPKLK